MGRQVGITEARKQLAHVIDQVEHQGESYVIIRHGRPAAAVVPMDVYRQWQREREELFDVMQSIQAVHADADPDQVMQVVLEAQQATRRSSTE